MFDHTCNFRIASEGIDPEELELEMIDFGAEEVFADEDGIMIYAPFESFGAIQKELENRNIEILSSGFDRIPQVTKELTADQVADVEKLLEKIEEDDDVQNVYTPCKKRIVTIEIRRAILKRWLFLFILPQMNFPYFSPLLL